MSANRKIKAKRRLRREPEKKYGRRRNGMRIDPLPYVKLNKNFANWPLCRDSRTETEWRSFGGGKTVRHHLITRGDDPLVTLILPGSSDRADRHPPYPMDQQVLFRLLADAQDILQHRDHLHAHAVGQEYMRRQARHRRAYILDLASYETKRAAGEPAKRPKLKLAFPADAFQGEDGGPPQAELRKSAERYAGKYGYRRGKLAAAKRQRPETVRLRYRSWAELMRRIGLNCMAANRRAVEASLRYWSQLQVDHRAWYDADKREKGTHRRLQPAIRSLTIADDGITVEVGTE